ncbi:helix-turn-helix domain-containing protein [Leptospira bouyouniensis]|uniref:Helix-turn-helix domain-containing protein n=1 Tax=Leptospira bouyouniensis TaxID=2484911 RepID=A0A7I0HW43_9LEPT|nr:helix-turn-helix domain-containing protein [Leptospira bouyouniensis]TGL08418.1 helix-turn-helix domain-containing protein [Leptospira bouyouniensis]
MRTIHRVFLALALLLLPEGCLWKPEAFYGRNISMDVEFLAPLKGSVPSNCDHSSIQKLKQYHWIQNRSEDSLRSKWEPQGQWLHFTIKNQLDFPSDFSVLIQWINIPSAEMCSENQKGEIIDSYSGYVWENWLGVLSPFPHFNVSLEPGESRDFYIYIVANENLNFPIRTISNSSYRFVVLFRFLTLLFFLMVGFVSAGWAISEFIKSKEFVYLSILFHFLLFFLLVYSVHGKELASLFDNENNIIKHSYYLFLSINHFVFFLYLFNFVKFTNETLTYPKLFWASACSGFLYLFIPLMPRVYEYRIFLVLVIFGSAAFFLRNTHGILFSNKNDEERSYFFSWSLFLFLVFLKTLFHFDFYPYQPFFIYASVFYLPFLTVGSFLFLRNYEKRDKTKTRFRTITNKIDTQEFRIKLESLLESEKIYLNENCNEELIAQKLGVTYHQLSEIINVEYNFNFPTLLNLYRIKEAKRILLEKPELNVAEVGKMAGFGSRSAFYLEFKKQSGVNPNHFRKSTSHPKDKNK